MVFKKLDFFSAFAEGMSLRYDSPKASGFYPFGIAKRLFFMFFCFGAPIIYSQNRVNPFFITDRKNRPFGVWEGGNKKASFERRLLVTPEGLEPSTH